MFEYHIVILYFVMLCDVLKTVRYVVYKYYPIVNKKTHWLGTILFYLTLFICVCADHYHKLL